MVNLFRFSFTLNVKAFLRKMTVKYASGGNTDKILCILSILCINELFHAKFTRNRLLIVF